MVNASTNAVTEAGRNTEKPSAIDGITVVTNIQLHLYNTETNSPLKDELMRLVAAISGPGTPIEPYILELSVDDIKDPDKQLYLNKIDMAKHNNRRY